MSDARAELLRRRLLGGASPRRTIVAEPRPERPVLSFAQERLWFIERLHQGSTAYSVPVNHRILGALDAGRLEQALAEIVARHESLRTRFGEHNGVPYQLVDPPGFRLDLVDLDADPQARSDAVAAADLARSLINADAGQPFDLAAGPLFRARLYRLAADDHVLALRVHHCVFDGWSLGVLRRELSACYAAACQGRPAELPELPVQYPDYAAWQRRELTGQKLATSLTYWRQRLAGAPLVLELPTDRTRPPEPSHRADRVSFEFEPAVTRALRELALAHQASLYMVGLSAFQALLGRHAGSTDLIVGSSVSGRGYTELEPMIGFFVNSLALRCDLAGDPPFASLLDQTREETLEDFAHQNLPLEVLVEELAPPRDLSRTPVTQVWFNMQNIGAELGELELDGLEVESFDLGTITTRFDLELHLTDGGGDRLTGGLIYATDLFDRRGMEWLAGHYARFLTEIARNPTQRLSRVPIVTADELALFAEWNTAID